MVEQRKQGNWLTRAWKRMTFAEDQAIQIDDSQASVVSKLHRSPIGSSGTLSYAGYPSEEYLPTLRGKRRADIFDEMRRSSPQIKMCLSAVKNPIKSATWEVNPSGDSDLEKKQAAFIRHVLFEDMDQPWKAFISEALSLCEFGHSVFEITHKLVLDDPEFGSYQGIRSLGFRSQRTLENWNLDPKNGKLASITQYAYGDLDRMVEIPAQFLLVFSLDKEGSNYEGISLLRPAYGPWFRQNVYLKLNAIGIEKFAIPTPIADIPDGKQNSAQYDALIEALENYTQHQSAYLTKPEGWTIDLKTNTYDPEKVEVSIDNEDKRIAKAFLANFLELGMNSVGSYALSNDLSDFFLGGLEGIADLICERINMDLIPSLIQLKWGPQQKYPKLQASGISDKAGKELADILSSLAQNKYLIPTNKDEDHLRKRLGLPERSSEGQREVQKLNPFTGT